MLCTESGSNVHPQCVLEYLWSTVVLVTPDFCQGCKVKVKVGIKGSLFIARIGLRRFINPAVQLYRVCYLKCWMKFSLGALN